MRAGCMGCDCRRHPIRGVRRSRAAWLLQPDLRDSMSSLRYYGRLLFGPEYLYGFMAIPADNSVAPLSPVKIFYSYSHKDEALRDELEKHLSILKRQGVISGWHDRRIAAGSALSGR